MSWIDGKEVLITGGTGSLGKTLTWLLQFYHVPKGIRIYSRDELKQSQMQAGMGSTKNVAFLLGDVRDRLRLRRAMEGVDLVIHTAALKQVPACEYNPVEAAHTNVTGSINVLECALDTKVKRVMYTNTDKAVHPINLYGATKMVAEKIFIHGNVYSGGNYGTQFSVCRYGNVLGSRGSVIQVWEEQVKADGCIKVTDPEMTRFWVSLPTMGKFILRRIEEMQPGIVYVPYLPACSIAELAEMVHPMVHVEIVGTRQGEKIHETLVTAEEMLRATYCIASLSDDTSHYMIRPGRVLGEEALLFEEYRSDTAPKLSSWKLKQMMEDGH